MVNKQNSLPMPFGVSVHQLKGKALLHWWQIGRPNPGAHCNNPTIFSQVMLLAGIPVVAMLAYLHSGPPSIKLILLLTVVGLANFVLLVRAVRRKLYYVLEVRKSDDGLLVKSLFFKRKIRWFEIRDFFPIQAIGTLEPEKVQLPNKEFLLECTNADQFILSSDLTDSTKLFEDIKDRIPKPTLSYNYSYRVPDATIDSQYVASFAIVTGLCFPTLKALLYSLHLDLALFCVSVVTLWIAWFMCWLASSKWAQLVRIGPSSILIRTRSGSRVLAWDQITGIKHFLGNFLVKSRDDWYLILSGKKEPLRDKLIECKTNLLTQNRMRL